MPATSRLAVLASGRGSNLRVLLEHLARPDRIGRAEVALVASDKADAGALAIARAHGIAAAAIEARGEHEAPLLELLRAHRIDLVVLAGYLRLVPAGVVRAFAGRMINVHPALLPAFGGQGMYGARVHRAVLASGARVSGPTVHFVDEQYDRGPIIAQWPVPVLEHDDEHALAARVLHAEHRLLPRVVEAVATGRIALDGGRVRGAAASSGATHFALADAGALEASMDLALGTGA